MIFRLFRRTPPDPRIALLYGAIVAQARLVAFYRDYGVPDAVNGRFEMIVLHLVLVLQRLERADEAGRTLGQGVFDHFCRDMDDNLRELGVGDLSVPKTMRAFGEAFYGRREAYTAALATPDRGALALVLRRNVFGDENRATPAGACMASGAERLAAYVRVAAGGLATQEGAALCSGTVEFPDPMQIVVHGQGP